ncbi:MAG: alpha/beta hydrolase [Acidobacteriota bacterium]|nr:alpha/beta hydrolase [Acidobacteriota bacterium]
MSWQAFISRQVVRMIVKSGGGKNVPHEKVRRHFETVVGKVPGPPFQVDTEEISVEGVPCTWYRTGINDQGVILYFHGGGYVVGSPRTHRALVSYLARRSGAAVLSVDYRLAPENPFPAAVEDAVKVYKYLVESGIPVAKTAVGGDSAGGGLTFATLVHSRDHGLPMPAAAFAFSPWTDLSLSGDSVTTNRHREVLIHNEELRRFSAYYLGETEPETPLASPLFADLSGLPPVFIQVSSAEVLRDDSLRMEERLKEAGVPVTCEVWRKMQHVWQFLPGRLPEARKALRNTADFLHRQWGIEPEELSA